MQIILFSFTERGALLGKTLSGRLSSHQVRLIDRTERPEDAPPVTELAARAFSERSALLFIGASGIAVRAIAPSVRDKLADSPVLVMDEAGQFVISLLSGHVGGANDLTREIADALNAIPVITTATDVNGSFAADVYAKEHDLEIKRREHIRDVAQKSMKGNPIVLSVEGYPSADEPDIVISENEPSEAKALWLRPKNVILGMGCRRGKSFEELSAFTDHVLKEHGLTKERVRAIASIDAKQDEEGLLLLAQKLQVPFVTFTTDMLNQAPGEYEESPFVREKMGVGNVCERAAALAAGPESHFLIRKTKGDGMTLAAVSVPWPGKRGII